MSEEGGRSSFILSDEMRSYYEKIGIAKSGKGGSKTGYFPTNIHPFYASMVMGVVKNKMAPPGEMSKDMVDEWVSDARTYEEELDGLGFYLHCKSLGLVNDEADNRILDEMKGFFEGQEKYTREGYQLMNKYAQGGFRVIMERIPDTKDLADWLSIYLSILEE